MCAPIATLALIGTAVSAVGTGVAALQANAQGRYQAQVADQNARLAADAARRETDATNEKLVQHYRQVSALEGQQRVAMAAGGIDLGFGNAADLQADTHMLAQEDSRRIYDQGAQSVLGYNIESANHRAQASASRQAATGALINGAFEMGSTALSGASQYKQLRAKFG